LAVRVDLYQIVIVNLSAFVLAGSHLVLSNTKAESIYRTAGWNADDTDWADCHGFFCCCAGCYATNIATPQGPSEKARRHKGKLLRNLGLATDLPAGRQVTQIHTDYFCYAEGNNAKFFLPVSR
jgi:hypothetical protein